MTIRRIQRTASFVLAVAAGLVMLGTAGWMTVDHVIAVRREARDKVRFAELLEKVQQEASYAAVLHTEYEQQTQASIQRSRRNDRLAIVLIVAGAAFVIGVKRFIALRDRPVALPRRLQDLLAERLAAARPPAESAGAAPMQLPILETVDLAPVDAIIARHGRSRDAVIPILQALQAHYRYLPEAALRHICEVTDITPAQLTGVASFYPQFRRTPAGEHIIKVCHGTACHVAGAPRITDELRRHLRIGPGEDTDPTRTFTIEPVACMGCCTLAPVAQLDDTTHGHLHTDTAVNLLTTIEQPRINGRPRRPAAAGAGEIRIGLGSCCIAGGSGEVHEALHDALSAAGAAAVVKRVGCVGMCHQTPLLEISTAGAADRSTRYARVQPEHAAAIIRRHFRAGSLVHRIRNTVVGALDELRNGTGRRVTTEHQIALPDPPVAAFLGRQCHIATEHCGRLDPTDVDEYLEHGGFQALRRCVAELGPEEVVQQVARSGLRGRGGAGFPTAEKWSRVGDAEGDGKYVICNGDEGDPGAFMDRMLMESYPYRIIEGVAIAAYATGATEGVFYIRREYPLAARRIRDALTTCEQRGLLGDLRLRLRIVEGAGAFVCGEETALIATLEGRRGMPSLRPPYPAERGLWGRPTLVNNVETFAVVPWIIRNGPEAFARLGTETSKGTKVFALAGKVRRGGLIEVPMGITVRQIVEEIGGGIKEEPTAAGLRPRRFKAVQIGGPSGGCVPAELADTPVDFEALARVGAIMGSGGLVVLDETDCMVDIARYFLTFTQNQSCGRCTPCRVGARRLLDILERLCNGEGRRGDLEQLEELAHVVAKSSLCGLGQTAPNPVITTLRYFRDEYEAHLQGRCPAGRCQALIRYEVTDVCTGCTLCAQHCPAGAIEARPYEQHAIDPDLCTRCDLCRTRCPEEAIRIV